MPLKKNLIGIKDLQGPLINIKPLSNNSVFVDPKNAADVPWFSTSGPDKIDLWLSRQTGVPILNSTFQLPTVTADNVITVTKNISSLADFTSVYLSNECFKIKTNTLYANHLKSLSTTNNGNINPNITAIYGMPKGPSTPTNLSEKITAIFGGDNWTDNFDITSSSPVSVGTWCLSNALVQTQAALDSCRTSEISKKNNGNSITKVNTETFEYIGSNTSPFDRRLDRLRRDKDDTYHFTTPFATEFAEASTIAFTTTNKTIAESNLSDEGKKLYSEKLDADREKMRKNNLYVGVPALQNSYAIIKLYGSNGGEKLINRKNERRWYEVDQTSDTNLNYASVPTTSAIISWGAGDPYDRTPYHFSDFAMCKYWNKIPNNRMITLRRYPAPILDNLKFPGMDKDQTKTPLPPVASAVTYFGGDSGNTLSQILKFTTGVSWEDVKADVWPVNTQSGSAPGLGDGPGKLFGGKLTSFAEMLNVAGGEWGKDKNLLTQNSGQLPPDPYKDGPYENMIMGPLNRIDSVKKRKPGLTFTMDGINLVFEYVARPIGGINPKAVILDIMSNFLVMGSATAVFFGGAHRFMANPAIYPFAGGDKGIEAWYSGNPTKAGGAILDNFAKVGVKGISNIFDQFSNLLSAFTSGGNLNDVFKSMSGGVVGNLGQRYLSKQTAGTIPYLTGMKALLTGEPVGDWHVTIGNPLNPIAMIGNLICTGITVDMNDELGPDDFPTEIKITVKLDHGMPRDKDAIQSIFNRGMGRIYDLPDYLGSADAQTKVDAATTKVGSVTNGNASGGAAWDVTPKANSNTSGRTLKQKTAVLSNKGETSVWGRMMFDSTSPNVEELSSTFKVQRTDYRSIDWVAMKGLK